MSSPPPVRPDAPYQLPKRKVKTMVKDYPQCVLDGYGAVVAHINTVDALAERAAALLGAIEAEAVGAGRVAIMAGLAREARAHLAKIDDATIEISEYCRAADVAYERSEKPREAVQGRTH